nr:hypothetical protein PHYPA_011870 [Physcomitrium patens]
MLVPLIVGAALPLAEVCTGLAQRESEIVTSFEATYAVMNGPTLTINQRAIAQLQQREGERAQREAEIVTSAKAIHNLGRMNVLCPYCNALDWFDEHLARLPRKFLLFV